MLRIQYAFSSSQPHVGDLIVDMHLRRRTQGLLRLADHCKEAMVKVHCCLHSRTMFEVEYRLGTKWSEN